MKEFGFSWPTNQHFPSSHYARCRFAAFAAFDTPEGLCYFATIMFESIGFGKQATLAMVLTVSLSLLITLIGCKGGASRISSQTDKTAAEADVYRSKIELSKVGLAKGENYLGSEVFYVEGWLKNTGDRVVQRVEITFLFRDSLKQVVLRESRKALEYKGGRGLDADKSTRFQVAFDHLPKDWNYVLPDIEVSQVTLKD